MHRLLFLIYQILRKLSVSLVIFSALACQTYTGMHRVVKLNEPILDDCIVDATTRIKEARISRLGEGDLERYVFQRDKAVVEMHVSQNNRQELTLGFVWKGSPDKSREADHLALMNEVQNAVLESCRIPASDFSLKDHCEGMKCP